MWMTGPAGSSPVDKAVPSPLSANRRFRLAMRVQGIITVVHTLYDYDKGIS
jgi:hypothetical protein